MLLGGVESGMVRDVVIADFRHRAGISTPCVCSISSPRAPFPRAPNVIFSAGWFPGSRFGARKRRQPLAKMPASRAGDVGTVSAWHWIIVLIVVVVVFGSGRLASAMGDFGQGIKAFRAGLKDDPPPPPTQPG